MPSLNDELIDFQSSKRIKDLIVAMFVDTADENYITARWAINNGLEIDFYWLAMHCVEKYLKAILMLNKKSVKGYNHDISRLYSDFKALDPRIEVGTLRYPTWMPDDSEYRNENAENIVQRLNNFGDPNNRYAMISYDIGNSELFRLDNLVWYLRRHCCELRAAASTEHPEQSSDRTNLDFIINDLSYESYRGRLEEIIAGPRGSLRDALLSQNYAFDPQNARTTHQWGAGRSSLLTWTIGAAEKEFNSEISREAAKKALSWARDNMPMSKADRDRIDNIISNQGRNAS